MTTHAWRLTFAYDGDDFTLKSARKLVKRVPPGQSLDAMVAQRSGRFVELRGSKQEILYRRAVTNLIPDTVEYPTGNPERPLGRVTAPIRGQVSVLVPSLPDASMVAIVETGKRRPSVDKSSSATGEKSRVGARSDHARPDSEAVSDASRSRDLIAIEMPREGESK